MALNNICVYCGSQPGRDPAFASAARALGHEMVARRLGLVYGGAQVGLMGEIADTVLAAGGTVVGVMPRGLVEREVAHEELTELLVTDSMHERKTTMASRADAFVAMPGGIGTLEELFEIWTWQQLGMHAKPCGLLNVDGYFDALIAFLDHAVSQGFVRPGRRLTLLVSESPSELLDALERFQAPPSQQWIGPEET